MPIPVNPTGAYAAITRRLKRHGPRIARSAFAIAGIAGMLMIVRPGADIFHGASLLAVANALVYAIYQILTRMVADETRASPCSTRVWSVRWS
jgi:drug/metabolite transporter (DMT)-like permease